jgi:rod shape-determining protein MreC
LQIFCIVLLSKYSKTHEAFFASKTNEVVGFVDKNYNGVYSYFGLKDENKKLHEENERLRNLLSINFTAPDSTKKFILDTFRKDSLTRYRKFTYLPALVVGNNVNSQTNYLIVERGSNQGIRKGMGVIGPQGVVGEVTDVSTNYCRVMSMLNKFSRVSAGLKNDKTYGDIEWDGKDPSYLTLLKIPKSVKVAKGDTVITSSYSSKFPEGIMIGTVADITTEQSKNVYILKIKTATNFYNIQHVSIIENIHAEEQTQLENTKPKISE